MDFNQFKKQVDKYRVLSKKTIVLTKEQKEFIKLCKTGEAQVPIRKMAELWEQFGWGRTSHYAIQSRIELMRKDGELDKAL